jgi:hypothetical protein
MNEQILARAEHRMMVARNERRISEPQLYVRCQGRLQDYMHEAEHEALLRQIRQHRSSSADTIHALWRALGTVLVQVGQRLQGTDRVRPAPGSAS